MPKGKRIEPLDLDEMASSSSLNGLMAFREFAPIGLSPIGASFESAQRSQTDPLYSDLPGLDEAVRKVELPSTPTGLTPIGLTGIGITPTPIGTVSESSERSQSSLIASASINSNGGTSKLDDDLPPIGPTPIGRTTSVSLSDVLSQLSVTPPALKSRGKVIPATKVEDGHSATQNTLYWYLWRKGRQVNGSRSHYVQAGYGQIQAALGIDRSNIQDAIRELQKKLALQVLKPSTVGSATVYEVFCCEAILEKRKTEGLIWAHRYGGRKVELLTSPNNNIALTPTGLAPTGHKPSDVSPIGSKLGVGSTPIGAVGVAPIEGIGLTPIHIVKGTISNNRSSSDVDRLRSFVESNLDQMDEDAAQKLLVDCTNRAGNQPVTVEQIIQAVQTKLAAARKARNPVGFLLVAVPKLFPLRGITTEPVTQGQQPEEDIEYLQQLIENPDATEPMREQAKDILSKVGGQRR